MCMQQASGTCTQVVSRCQTAFFRVSLVWRKNRSGNARLVNAQEAHLTFVFNYNHSLIGTNYSN